MDLKADVARSRILMLDSKSGSPSATRLAEA
jgi:hypothetical protein